MKKSPRKSHRAPRGWHTITPRIFTNGARDLIAFLKKVFDASGRYNTERPTEVLIGDSRLMVNDAVARAPMSAFLYVYVPNVGVVYRRAMRAGAKSIETPAVTSYGDLRCMFEDRWGNVWQVASRVKAPARRKRVG